MATKITRLNRESDPPAGKPASATPQYWDQETEDVEDVEGLKGAPFAMLLGTNGQPIGEENPLETRVRHLEDLLQSGNAKMQLSGSTASLNTALPEQAVLMGLSDGTNIQAMRGVMQGTLLASAQRTSNTSSPQQTNVSHRGVAIFVNVTSVPTNESTLTMALRVYGPVSGVRAYHETTFMQLNQSASTGLYIAVFYPGAVETSQRAELFVQGLPILGTWDVIMQHNNSEAWTYSVGYCYLV